MNQRENGLETNGYAERVRKKGENRNIYSGSKNCLDVWMFFTKVNNPTHLLTWALTCECMKESPYHRLSMGSRVKRIGYDLKK
jgi:hypothetical protein